MEAGRFAEHPVRGRGFLIHLLQYGAVGAAKKSLSPYADKILADPALVGYWKYDEAGFAVSAVDAGPNALHGLYANGPHPNSSLLGAGGGDGLSEGLSAALNDTIRFPNSPRFDTATEFTINFWHTVLAPIPNWMCLASRSDAAPIANGFSIWYQPVSPGVARMEFDMNTGGGGYDIVSDTGVIQIGVSAMYSIVFDGSVPVLRMHRNGPMSAFVVPSSAVASLATTSDFYVGQYGIPGLENWADGIVDEMSWHARAVGVTELTDWYNTGKP